MSVWTIILVVIIAVAAILNFVIMILEGDIQPGELRYGPSGKEVLKGVGWVLLACLIGYLLAR